MRRARGGADERTTAVRPTPRTALPVRPFRLAYSQGPAPAPPGRQRMVLTTRRRALTTLGAALAGAVTL
ncbi:hypothetical protein, partial [Streptomyces scabiei]|uniref:hypothetical protein n=1 Tax=Streptomyces scabiei TaxID=1930 RepID=UPI00131C7D5E